MDVPENSECRLCGGTTVSVFSKVLLRKHEVCYLKCEHCLSLQTETPYWLEEAYADDRPLTDCGMVARTLDLSAKTDLILSLLEVSSDAPCIDFGGSLGLYSRMMRDRGYNFYRSDKYSRNFYVPFHDAEDNQVENPCVVTAFEVLEHLANPRQEIRSIFGLLPDVVLVSTVLFADQPNDWWYYAPDMGQHVFFYNQKALQAIAECYQMHVISDGSLHLFCRKEPKYLRYGTRQLQGLLALFNNAGQFHTQSMNLLTSRLSEPYKWASKDYEEILGRIQNTAKTL